MPPVISGLSVSRRHPAHSRPPRERPWGPHPCPARCDSGTLDRRGGSGSPRRGVVRLAGGGRPCAGRARRAEGRSPRLGGRHAVGGRALDLRQTRAGRGRRGLVPGGTIGFVVGMLVGGPVGGALLGMIGGGVWGARDTGVPDARLRELGESLAPGGALLCALVKAGGDRRREALAPYGKVADADAPGVPLAAPVQQYASRRTAAAARTRAAGTRASPHRCARRAGQRQRPGEPRLDEAEAAGRDRDQREQHRGGVREHHEHGPDGRRPRRGSTAGRVVEARLGGAARRANFQRAPTRAVTVALRSSRRPRPCAARAGERGRTASIVRRPAASGRSQGTRRARRARRARTRPPEASRAGCGRRAPPRIAGRVSSGKAITVVFAIGRGQPGGHVRPLDAGADEQPVVKRRRSPPRPGRRCPRVARELGRPHGEPARRAQRDPLHLPQRGDARRLEDQGQQDPPRVEVGEGVPLRERVDEAREEEVERDRRPSSSSTRKITRQGFFPCAWTSGCDAVAIVRDGRPTGGRSPARRRHARPLAAGGGGARGCGRWRSESR